MSSSLNNDWQYTISFEGDNRSLIKSYSQTQIRRNNNNKPSWSFSSDGSANQEYNYLELFRFVAKDNSQTIDPKNLTLIVEVNDGTAKGITEMVAQIGNQYIPASPIEMPADSSSTKPQHFKFDLSKISEYLDGTALGNQATATEQTITIVPLYKADSIDDHGINLLGKESIVVSISGKNYWNADKNDFSGRDDFITLKTSTDFNNYDPSYPNPVTVGGKSYDVVVGALADYMLMHPGKKPIQLIIDGYKNSGVVQSSELLLSQNIIYRESGSKGPWEILGLAYDGQIYVQGSMQEEKPTDYTKQGAVIDGGNKTGDNTKRFQYSAGMLDLISTYQSTSSNPSIAVKGITFINNPRRGYGAITANTVYVEAIHQDDWDTSGNYDEKLAAAITAHNNQQTIDWKKQQANEVVFYDNQISTWLDQSDGFESNNTNQSLGLRIEKNFIHTADDSLKVGGSNQHFIDNTVHTGRAGSPVMISNYGWTAGPVNNTVIDGLYAHRVIQDRDDNYGGIIAYRTHFSDLMYDPYKPGINHTTLNNIYVPQFNFQKYPKLVANPVYRHSIVPAMGQAGWSALDKGRAFFGPKQAEGHNYNTGGITVSGWNVNPAAQKPNDRNNPYFLIGYYNPVSKTPQWNDEINSTPANQLVVSRPIYDKYPGNQSGKVNVYGVTHLKDVTNKILASHQTSESDAILDANNIFANPASFKVEITTNSAFMNRLYLAPLIKDEITGDFFANDTDGNRISVDNTDNFRNAIRNDLIPLFADNTLYGGEGNRYEFSFKLMPSESSYYTPVLINPNDELFTYGELSSYGFDNLRVLADQSNTFYFEDQKGLGDNDRNDLIAKFTVD